MGKRFIINSEKRVFTVHLVTACSFFYCQNVIQIFFAVFSVVNEQAGMKKQDGSQELL